MKSRRVTVALLLGLLGAIAAQAQDSLGSFRFERNGHSYRIPSIRSQAPKGTPGLELISLRGLAAALGMDVNTEEVGSFRVGIGGAVVRFPADNPWIVRVNDGTVSFSREARRIGSDLYVPAEFLKRVVTPLLEGGEVHGQEREDPVQAREAPAQALAPLESAPAVSQEPAPAARRESASAVRQEPGAAVTSARPEGVRAEGARADAKTSPSNLVVVLDPGHGGSETGAEGKTGIFEKEVTLDIARRLKAILGGRSDVTVLLTRETDEAIGLDERTALANQNHADLFVSIHVNSAPRSDARGAETYFLALKAKDEEIRTLAAIENNAAGVDRERMGDVPQGLELILWDLAQSQYLEGSSRVAEAIQNELNDALGVKNRGVKQAPFRVLMGATMPAVLVEVGFISNADEEISLKTEDYRDKIAQALARAVIAYIPEARKRFTTPTQRVR